MPEVKSCQKKLESDGKAQEGFCMEDGGFVVANKSLPTRERLLICFAPLILVGFVVVHWYEIPSPRETSTI